MTPQQLKNSILQLAITGKLLSEEEKKALPQEPVQDLIAQIKAEKEKLIKEGKIKKSKALPAISEEEKPFDIPENWEWVRLGEISKLITKGTTPRGGNVRLSENSEVGFLRAENIVGLNKLNLSNIKYISKEINETFLKRSQIFDNDILITIAGTLGRTGLATKEYLPLNSNQAISIVRLVNPSRLNLMYLLYSINCPAIQKLLTNQKKVTAIPNLTLEIISNLLIPVPPLKEQQAIVAKLDKILPFIDLYAEKYHQLNVLDGNIAEQLKKSLLQQAITGKLLTDKEREKYKTESASQLLKDIKQEKEKLIKEGKIKKSKALPVITEEEKPFDIPENWVWVRLEDISIIITDGAHKTPKYTETGIPFLSIKNISSGKFDLTHIKYISKEEHEILKKRILPEKNDILFCRIGTLGKALKNTLNFEFSIFVSLGLIRLIDINILDWIIYLINSPFGDSWISNNKVGAGTHTSKINLSSLRQMVVPIPPLSEQQAIISQLKKSLAEIEQLKALTAHKLPKKKRGRG